MKNKLVNFKNTNPLALLLWNELRIIKGNKNLKKYSDSEFIKKQNKNIDISTDNPKGIEEKFQWLKLYERKKLMTKCADKYSVRDHIESKGYGDTLNDLFFEFENINSLNLKKLPNKFVLKGAHGSGWNLIVKDKNKINWTIWKHIINSWLKQNYYNYSREWVYKDIKPRIIVEKYLEDESGELMDYKFHCFNGNPAFIQVDTERFSSHRRNLYDLNWNLLSIKYIYENTDYNIKKPVNINKMLKIAKELSKDFSFVRVDFYEVNGKIVFGEMTFYPEGGGKYPKEFNELFKLKQN